MKCLSALACLLLAGLIPLTQANAAQPVRAPARCPVIADDLFPSPPALQPASPPSSPPAAPAQVPWNRWLLDCVPPLRNDRTGRWPLVFWHGPQWEGVSDADLKAYAARGMVPTVRLVTDDIPRAQRLQGLGLPVVALEGKGGS